MLLPCLADVIAIFLYIDGTNCATVAVVMPHCGNVFFWQILLPGLADVIATCCCVWQMLLPIWLMLLPFVTCYVGQMLFARVADGIAYQGGCGV